MAYLAQLAPCGGWELIIFATAMGTGEQALWVGFGAVVVSALLYWATKQHSEKLHRAEQQRSEQLQSEQQRRARIDDVVSGYLRKYETGWNSGLHALIESGVQGLEDSDECWEVVNEIERRTGRQPLPQEVLAISNLNLKAFLAALRIQGPQIPNYSEVLKRFSGPPRTTG